MKDFENQWREKLHNSLCDKKLPEEIKETEDNILYSKKLMAFLRTNYNEVESQKIMLNCACIYPHENLMELKDLYNETNNLELVHSKLQKMFEQSITLHKNMRLEHLKENGWGMAGILSENTIIATKIPKDVENYFVEKDTSKKKFHYCHCPRVRELLMKDEVIDSLYCFCGAGFYRDIWNFITGKEVVIEILKSVMKGDEVCQIKITII